MTNNTQEHLQKVKEILSVSIKEAEFFAYGSRMKETTGIASDLDIMVKAKNGKRLSMMDLGEARELLAASNIPFRVDVHDYYTTEGDFLKMIEGDFVGL